ncbi:MAG TPA: NAD(P)-dependent oxidoreductase [Acetobacteraceae bacterium]|jgi:3-hydroxyisobutyrate dehydrogenase|nr:NAD(P)-dependent oxidoreductase [Acetobacteraceae bacterium]
MDERLALGFVGIGIMGEAMVRRLLDRGWRVTVWNREPARLPTVVPHGAIATGSPAEVAEAADIVMLCVLNTEAVEACVFGPSGIASARRPPRTIVDLSTIDPDVTERIAARLDGSAWVDAPVSGGPEKARAGTLAIMAGGADDAIAAVRPVLTDLGRATHMGGIGAGQRTKIVNQAIVATGYVLMAEAVALAEAAGIDAAAIPECLAGGMADGALLQVIFRQMQARSFMPPRAYARQLLKDMVSIRGFANERSLSLPVVESAIGAFARFASRPGNEMRDPAEVVTAYTGQRG